MSEPGAVVALLNLSSKKFKSALESESADLLTQTIVRKLEGSSKDFPVLHYDETEERLFAFFYFHYGDKDALLNSVELDFLTATAKIGRATGDIFISLDALNLLLRDITISFHYKSGIVSKTDKVSESAFKNIVKLAEEYFFNQADADPLYKILDGSVIPESLVNKCKKQMAIGHLEKQSKDVPVASTFAPLHFFGPYFYNGQDVYHVQGGKVTILKEIEGRSFRQTSYGACDNSHVVVDSKILLIDPSKFKKYQKAERINFTDGERVYDENLVPWPNSEAKSFKLESDLYGVDRNNIYFYNMSVSRDEIGNFRVIHGDYYWRNAFLIGEKQVYFGNRHLDVDPNTFDVLEQDKETSGIENPYFVIAKDSKGFLLIVRGLSGNGAENELQLIRSQNPYELREELINKTKSAALKTKSYPLPKCINENYKQHVLDARAWLDQRKTTGHQSNSNSLNFYEYIKLNNLLYSCWQTQELVLGIELYQEMKSDAWINPHIFHHMACIYLAQGQAELALDQVRLALVFGYEEFDKLLVDPDLQKLHAFDRWGAIEKSYTGRNSPIHLEHLEKVMTLSIKDQSWETGQILKNILDRVTFPSLVEIEALEKAMPNGPNQIRLEKYVSFVKRIFEEMIPLVLDKQLGEKFLSYQLLTPVSLWTLFLDHFCSAHPPYGTRDGFDRAKVYLEELQKILNKNNEALTKLSSTAKSSDFLLYLLHNKN